MDELIAALRAQIESILDTARNCPDPKTTAELEHIGAELQAILKNLQGLAPA
jgi:hypothetical protein